jgi:kynureninase
MRGGTLVNTFKKLGDAYSAAADGDVIQAQEMGFPETLTFAKSTVFSFQGGYDSEFVLNPGMTTLQGILTIQEGALTVENLILK